MSFIKRDSPWKNGDDVVPEDLNRYENALDDHERNKANNSDIGVLLILKTAAKVIVNAINELFDSIATKLNKDDVVNNLTTTDVTKALAAPQGKALDDKISNLSGKVGDTATLTTTAKTSTVAAINELFAKGLLAKPIPTGATSLSQITTPGIYSFAGGNTLFSDFPSYFTSANLIYGVLEVCVAPTYITKKLTVTNGTVSTVESAECFSTPTGSGITPWRPNAKMDKIDALWSGSASSGDITLSASLEGYNEVLVSAGKVGSAYDQVCSSLAFSYPLVFHFSSPIIIPHYAGSIVLVPKSQVAGNKIYTFQTNTQAINIYTIKGVKRGSV